MKQGSASYTAADKKREPTSTALSPGGVSQIGQAVGNHASDPGKTTNYTGDRVRIGAGYSAPMDDGRTTHHSGSQGKH